MKTIACILALALAPTLALAAEKPDWAFAVTEKEQPSPRIPGDKARTVGNVTVTRAGADDFFNIPNWRPDMYPALPKIVQYGNKDTQVRACGACHLPTGTGHDESAYVAGLTQRYFMQQMADWKSGNRKFGATMIAMAKVITDAEVKEAADYFAALKPRPWIKVVEADTVPRASSAPATSGWCIPPAAARRSATASSRCRTTRRRWSIAIRSLALSPMCRRAASPRARRW